MNLKYQPRLDRWIDHSKRNILNLESMTATSYGWWEYVKVINGFVVFNDYRYSPTTGKHQRNMRTLLSLLGVAIDLRVECPNGLQNFESQGATTLYRQLVKIAIERDRKGSRKALYAERTRAMAALDDRIIFAKQLGARLTLADRKAIDAEMQEQEFKRLARKAYEADQRKQVANITSTPTLNLTGERPTLSVVQGGAR